MMPPPDYLWITDTHLPFLSEQARADWLASLQPSDGLLLGGDFATGPTLLAELEWLLAHYPQPVTIVLGNHDFYGSSVSQIRRDLRQFAQHHPRLTIFEPEHHAAPLQLSDHVWLCGTGGWGDCLAGTHDPLDLPLSDEEQIGELKLARARRLLPEFLRAWGLESARHLQGQLDQIPSTASTIVILTHVPPWPEAARHLGAPSTPQALPRFCCRSVGYTIETEAARRPEVEWLILAGHTHEAHLFCQGSIRCYTGGSHYSRPHRNGRLSITDKGARLTAFEGLGPLS